MTRKMTALIVSIVLLFGGGGYFLGRTLKENRERRSDEVIVTNSSSSTQSISSTSTKSSSRSSTSSTSLEKMSSSSSTTISKDSAPKRELPNNLVNYSDDEIEYARVWLEIRSTEALNDDAGFELNVRTIKKGEPVNPFHEGTVNWPFDVTVLSGKFSYQSTIAYRSNHDGSVTTYPLPSHWHYTQEEQNDTEFIKKMSQEILDDFTIVPISPGDPETIERLIKLEQIND
ncbi:MAG: hypothetical protein ACTJHC_09205 [Vagococcus sp.]